MSNQPGGAPTISRALKRWDALRNCGGGGVGIDNDAVGHALLAVTLRRKKYLFAGPWAGGKRGVPMCTLIADAHRAGLREAHRHRRLAFNKTVNANIVDPGFIVRVRRKLALDQRQAAELFVGGPNAFSRYKSGKTKPPLALVKLLIPLDRHPGLLSELQAER